MTRVPVRRALVSVSDKSGLAELGRALAGAGVEVVSTGSTAAELRDAGVDVVAVSDVTGHPEVLDGRVKTLHPAVHAGLLADRRRPEHVAQLDDLGIAPFDLLVVNLYPFAATVASGAGADAVVEQIDVGGPAMVRAAAKNHASVAVVVDPGAYPAVLEALDAGGFDDDARRTLAAAAFAHTAAYDAGVAAWFAAGPAPSDASEGASDVSEGISSYASGVEQTAAAGFPVTSARVLRRTSVLRYGENPHQGAALYVDDTAEPGLAQARQLHGKAMSYNNYVDTDAARRAASDHDGPCVAVVKHANPCGIAVAGDVAAAHAAAHACDPVSAFGGVIAVNAPVTRAMAEQVAQVFTEVVVAPSFDADALEVLTAKASLRLLECPLPSRAPGLESRAVSGGALLQDVDRLDAPGDAPGAWRLATGEPVADDVLADLAFAWRAVRAVRSNAVLLARGGATVGIGMGQVNRVDSSHLAVRRAGERAAGAVAASDAFFPFPDGLEVLCRAGVTAVVQPGGSVRDEEVVAAAARAGVALYLTGVRHFAH